MASMPLEMEGTWEEIAAHAAQLAGHRVRLTVLPANLEPGSDLSRPEQARDPDQVARVKRLRGKFARTDGAMASELLHQERQADKQRERRLLSRDER
jgi:hypothetical protein